jgi:hypothetical protein
MIVFMSVLWSYWSSPSLGIWLSYLTAAKESSPGEYAVLVAALFAVVAAGVFVQFVATRLTSHPVGAKPRAPLEPVSRPTLAWRPAAVFAAALLLLLLRVPTATNSVSAQLTNVASTLRTNALNDVDQERQDRGYYETLLDVPRSTAALAASSNALKDAAAGDAADEPAETLPPTGEQSVGTTDSISSPTVAAPTKDSVQR